MLSLAFILLCMFTYGSEFETSPYNKRIISLNPGISFSGSGDALGIGSEISHLKYLAPWIYHKETIASWIVNGSSWIDGSIENQNGLDFSIELGIAPFYSLNHALSLTGGICAGRINSISANSGGSYNVNGEKYYTYFDNDYQNQFDTGFTIGANYHYFVNSHLTLNLRAAFRGYNKTGNAISIMSFGVGYRIH